MKIFYSFVCTLLLSCVTVAAASCADMTQPKESSSQKGCPSEKIFVKIQGDNLHISTKMDSATDITYWFKRCMFNELFTFYRVGTLNNKNVLPSTNPDAEPDAVLNLAFSDNIGPFAIAGCGWCGANHKYMERSARTAYNDSYAIYADGNLITGDTTLWTREVQVKVKNFIFDPRYPYQDAAGNEELRDKLCEEQAEYRIDGNNIEVAVSHLFLNQEPVEVAIYYGMQSMFEHKTYLFTPQGAYPAWTKVEDASTFKKGDYPLFKRYIERSPAGYQATYLLPEGIGNHAFLQDSDDIFIYASYGKSYHKQIANTQFEGGTRLHWRGVYTWFKKPLADNERLLCYEGIVDEQKVLFVDCKRSGKSTLILPDCIDLTDCKIIGDTGEVTISPTGKHKLSIDAGAAGSRIIQLRD